MPDAAHDRMPELHRSWAHAWRGAGATGDGDAIHQALVAAYDEPHRKYHTSQHLNECIDLFETVEGMALHASEIELALWFHDAVYDVKRADNEESSAAWAKSAVLQAGAAHQVADRIHSLVMVTRHTGVPAAPDEQLLVDIDLAILGAGKERFAEYERQIREEYAFAPAWLFRRKRRAVLKSFLDRERIYGTDHFHERLEQRARDNLRLAVGKEAT